MDIARDYGRNRYSGGYRSDHTPEERWENVDGIFELHRSEHLAGKHILIVDDVLTTGATTVACASRLAEIEGVRISVLTLAMAE